MERAFEDAAVTEFEAKLGACQGLPDPKDAHVLAVALKTRVAIIVTEAPTTPLRTPSLSLLAARSRPGAGCASGSNNRKRQPNSSSSTWKPPD
jgi:hypothetical protein